MMGEKASFKGALRRSRFKDAANGLVYIVREVAEMASAARAVSASGISIRAVQNQPAVGAHVHGATGDRISTAVGGGDGLVLDELAAGRQ